jgi:hypothetical protein
MSVVYCISDAIAQQTTREARAFECGFIYDKIKTGKSGDASCSYTGEKVFSTASKPFPAREHCDTKRVFSFEDIRLNIDFVTNQVAFEREDGLAPFAVEEMIDY